MKKYIISLDQGTTSSRCIIFNSRNEIVSISQKEIKQYYPNPSWVEHDPLEIWDTQLYVTKEAVEKANIDFTEIGAIGITNQRETTVVLDKNSGKPITNAIVWQCRRTADYCNELKAKGFDRVIKEKTGLIADAYFSATKLKWILDNTEGAREKAMKGELLFGTIDTWLLWNLSGGKIHATDYSNASRTMLFNIHSLMWDDTLLEEFGIPKQMLPDVYPSSNIYGLTSPTLFGAEIPIGGIAGDQQAALFGQTCFEKGDVKNTYGTGCFLLMNIGDTPCNSEDGLITTIAWGLNGKITYALEGSVFVAGAAIQWLRDELKLISTASESEEIANKVSDTNGVYLVPAFTGLGAPYWDPYAKGTITGITRGVNRNHIVRAALEAIAYQSNDVVEIMKKASGTKISVLNVDGGASANNFLMQFQADITNTTIHRPACIESTALGAAFLAGLAVGFYPSLDHINDNRNISATFYPSIDDKSRTECLKGWHKAVKHSFSD